MIKCYGLGLVLLTVVAIGGFIWSLSPATVTTPLYPEKDHRGKISRFSEDMPTQRTGRRNTKDQRRGGHSHHNTAVVTGSMTLGEVSAKTGISLETLKHGLHLPNGISPNERLGRLKRRYGFEIEDVRHMVAAKGE